ncbi:MAG: peptide deformylase [Candidatus Helarchaeota archaeon]|nr:peptide deformylase [Candidatus Helarchaeota archaeon]
MAVITINKYGNPILRKKAKPIEKITSEELDLIDNMIETMVIAEGIGLAANQIGIPKSIAVVNFSFFNEQLRPQALLNIELIESKGSLILEEGCLSIPGIKEEVKRPESVKISYMDVFGETKTLECEGLLARVILHELDHLQGILFVDRLPPLKRKFLSSKLKKIIKGIEFT